MVLPAAEPGGTAGRRALCTVSGLERIIEGNNPCRSGREEGGRAMSGANGAGPEPPSPEEIPQNPGDEPSLNGHQDDDPGPLPTDPQAPPEDSGPP